jgi:hypothetical protein
MHERRWDNDERGRGIGSAVAHEPGVRQLLTEMAADSWVAEEPEKHILPHLRRFCEQPGSSLRLVSAEGEPNGTYAVTLQWVGAVPSRHRRREVAYALIGTIAEQSTHVLERPNDDGSEFEVVSGQLEGDGPFRGHGHTLRIRVLQGS